MNVQELITALQQLPPEADVTVIDSDGYLYVAETPDILDKFKEGTGDGMIAIPIDTTS